MSAILRRQQPPVLAAWRQFAPYFTPPGAHAFQRAIPNSVVQLLPTGHFALEYHLEEITQSIRKFLAKQIS
jgi:pimeloyl-ACP methyl ester carboxylesterase